MTSVAPPLPGAGARDAADAGPLSVPRDVRAPALVGLAALAVGALTMSHWPVGLFWDDGAYLVLAKALATGHGYVHLNLPGEPAATRFPPAYPLLLAALWKMWPFFPSNVTLFKAANVLTLAAAAVGTFHLACRVCRFRPDVAALVTLSLCLASPLLTLAGGLFSEPLFLAVLMPTLLAAERAAYEGDAIRGTAAGALAGALTLVRTVGAAAVIAGLAVLLARRRWRVAAAFGGAALLLVLPWQLWAAAHAGAVPHVLRGFYGSYLAWVADAYRAHGPGFAAAVAGRNLDELALLLGLVAAGGAERALQLLAAPLVALFALGMARAARVAPVCAAFVALYLAVVLLWPYQPDRFVWAVWPLLGMVVALGIAAATEWRQATAARRGWRIVTLGAAAMVTAGYARLNVRSYLRHDWDANQRAAAARVIPLARWAAARTRPADVLAADAEPLIYLYTGRRTVPPGSFRAEEYLPGGAPRGRAASTRQVIEHYGVRYLLASSYGAQRIAERLLRADPPAVALLYTLEHGGAVFVTTRALAAPRAPGTTAERPR